MTLLVTLKGSDGLVMAADSRGTFGDPRGVTAQNDAQVKAHILSSQVAVLAAGSGEVGSLIIEEAKRDVGKDGLDGVTPVMEAFRRTARAKYTDWFPTVPAVQPIALVATGQVPVRPDLAFLVGGYETDGSTSRIYQLRSIEDFAPMLHDYGFAVQGVVQYALYLLNRLYQPDRTVQELTALAVYVVTETASQDGKVGGPVNLVTVRPGAEGCRVLDPDDIEQVMKDNEGRSRSLRESFYERR